VSSKPPSTPLSTIGAIVLAAGKGTRMKSTLPKVLHAVGGKPMVEHVLGALVGAGVSDICLVLSEEWQQFQPVLSQWPHARVCIQKDRLGTGHAVATAAAAFSKGSLAPYAPSTLIKGSPSVADHILICTGDTPALRSETLKEFIQTSMNSTCSIAVAGMRVPEPKGYGRLIQDTSGALTRIVEENDADEATKNINLCNTGVIFARTDLLFDLLKGVKNQNAKHEYYLTDMFEIARQQGHQTLVFEASPWQDFSGINDPSQLAQVQTWMQERKG